MPAPLIPPPVLPVSKGPLVPPPVAPTGPVFPSDPLAPVVATIESYWTPQFQLFIGVVVAVGLALIALYFISAQFRVASNLVLFGTPDRSGKKGNRKGRPSTWKSGWIKGADGKWSEFDADGDEAFALEYAYTRNRLLKRRALDEAAWGDDAEYNARRRKFQRGLDEASWGDDAEYAARRRKFQRDRDEAAWSDDADYRSRQKARRRKEEADGWRDDYDFNERRKKFSSDYQSYRRNFQGPSRDDY